MSRNRIRKAHFRASSLKRRTVLASGIALIAAPLFRAQETRAQAATKPHFIAIQHPLGQMTEWLPSGGTTDFELSEQTTSLQPFRDRLLFVRGMRSALTENLNTDGAHVQGVQATFTGRRPTQNTSASAESINISIDQEIAQLLGADSLALGVLSGGRFRDVISHRSGGEPIYPEKNAVKVFDLLFSDVGGDQLAQQKLRAQRQSMFDAWEADLTDLKTQLGAQQQRHLDAHLTELRGLELDLAKIGTACEAPMMAQEQADYYTRSANYRQIGKQMMDLIVAAFGCDRAQVASLMWHTGGQAGITYPWLESTTSHHTLTHASDREEADDQLRRVYTWYTEQFAYLLQKLSESPHGEGSLLDNTVLFWTSSLGAHRSHNGRDMRVLVAGNVDGYFNTGQYIQSPTNGSLGQHRPLNDLMGELVRGVAGQASDAFHSDDMNSIDEMLEIRA